MISRKLCLGTAQFGMDYGIKNKTGKISSEEVQNILRYAKKKKIQFLDTAISYQESERAIGQFKFNNFNIISKIPGLNEKNIVSDQDIISLVYKSLERLNQNSIYAYLIHDASDIFGEKKNLILKSLDKIKNYGLAKKVGISIYEPSIITRLLEIYPFDIIQLPVNIIDRRLITKNYYNFLKNKNIEIHARSIFLQGLLLLNKNEQMKFSKYKIFFKSWNDWLNYNKFSNLQACLSYVNNIDMISKLIIGIDNIYHLKKLFKIELKTLSEIPDWSNFVDDTFINPSKWKFKRIYEK